MRVRIVFLFGLCALGFTACSGLDSREWMKVNQRYTKEEFQRDHKECSREEKAFEGCMRQRGWVPVSPSKADSAPPPDPVPRSRGRY